MRMSFEHWLETGWLKAHKPTAREIAELLAVADRALKDCQVSGLSSEGRLDMAHNAALQSSAAALAAAGYRASREAYHYYLIQSCRSLSSWMNARFANSRNSAANGTSAIMNGPAWSPRKKRSRWLSLRS